MPVAVNGAYPQHSGNFIPEIWSTKLNTKFYEATVLPYISNSHYEGEITTMGDKVNIRTIPDIVVGDYQKGQDLDYENPDSDPIELLIDKAKYFAFGVDDVDKYQSDLSLLDDWATDGSEQMKIQIDRDVLGDIVADAHADNVGPTAGAISGDIDLGEATAPVSLDTTNIIDYIVHMGTVLDEQDIPETGRWMVIPSWVTGLIKRSELKDASLAGDGTSILRNGRIGMIDRFTCYRSNLTPTATEAGPYTAFYVLAGHTQALTFASQMTKMEQVRRESKFGDAIRGLNVFGYEVTNPEALTALYARKPA